MAKSVNIRLDAEKDKDILEMIEHSKVSNVQLFKSLARIAIRNVDISNSILFDEDYINSLENDVPSNVKNNNNNAQKEDKKEQIVTPVKKDVTNDNIKEEKVIENNNNEEKVTEDDDKPNLDALGDIINSRFKNIEK